MQTRVVDDDEVARIEAQGTLRSSSRGTSLRKPSAADAIHHNPYGLERGQLSLDTGSSGPRLELLRVQQGGMEPVPPPAPPAARAAATLRSGLAPRGMTIRGPRAMSPRGQHGDAAFQSLVEYSFAHVDESVDVSPLERQLISYINSRAASDDADAWERVRIDNGSDGEELARLLNSGKYDCPELCVIFSGELEPLQRFCATLSGSNPRLMSLDFTGSSLQHGYLLVTTMLVRQQLLKRVVLAACQLPLEAMQPLSEALQHNHSVQLLDLSRNDLTWEAARALAPLIRLDLDIKELVLRGNRLGEGALTTLLLACNDREATLARARGVDATSAGSVGGGINAPNDLALRVDGTARTHGPVQFVLDISDNTAATDETVTLAASLLRETCVIGLLVSTTKFPFQEQEVAPPPPPPTESADARVETADEHFPQMLSVFDPARNTVSSCEGALVWAKVLIAGKQSRGALRIARGTRKGDIPNIVEGFILSNPFHSWDFSNNNFARKDVLLVLAYQLPLSSAFYKLNLSRCQLNVEGARCVSIIANQCTGLRWLDVSGNNFAWDGLTTLCNALKTGRIGYLFLNDCSIGPKEARLVGEMLQSNRSITYLEANKNELGPDGAAALGKCLNRSLLVLKLSGCGLRSSGVRELLTSVATRPNVLAQLVVKDNGLRSHDTPKLLDVSLTSYRAPHLLEVSLGEDFHEHRKQLKQERLASAAASGQGRGGSVANRSAPKDLKGKPIPLPDLIAEALRINDERRTQLDQLMTSGASLAAIRAFVERGDVSLGPRSSGRTPLHEAAAFSSDAVVLWMLENPLLHNQLNFFDRSYMTPLHVAATRGDEAVCRVLVAEGADAMVRDRTNRVPLDMVPAEHQERFRRNVFVQPAKLPTLSGLKLWDNDKVVQEGVIELPVKGFKEHEHPTHPWNFVGTSNAAAKRYQHGRLSLEQRQLLVDILSAFVLLFMVYEAFEIPFRWGFQPSLPGGYFALALFMDMWFAAMLAFYTLGMRGPEDVDMDSSALSFLWGDWKTRDSVETRKTHQQRRRAVVRAPLYWTLVAAAIPLDFVLFFVWLGYDGTPPGLAYDVLQGLRFVRMFVLARSSVSVVVLVGAFNLAWWYVDISYMFFYFFLIVQVAASLYYFEGRWALQLGYQSWLTLTSSYPFASSIDLANSTTDLWDKYGVCYFQFTQVAVGGDPPMANGLEATIAVLFKLGLTLLFAAYIFGLVIGRLEALNEKRRGLQDIQDQVLSYCGLLGIADTVERKIVAKWTALSNADVPLTITTVGDMMRPLSYALRMELSMIAIYGFRKRYIERRESDSKELATLGETSWGLSVRHLGFKKRGRQVASGDDVELLPATESSAPLSPQAPPPFPLTNFMYTWFAKLCFHPEKDENGELLQKIVSRLQRHFYVAGSFLFNAGDTADSVYLVHEGQVNLYVGRVRGGGPVAIRCKLGPGDFCGNEALKAMERKEDGTLKPSRYNTSCKAVSNVWVWRLDAKTFHKAVQNMDEFRRDFGDPWMLAMKDLIENYCLTYFKPDLRKNDLVKSEVTAEGKELISRILVDTVQVREKTAKEKKSLEKRVEELQRQTDQQSKLLNSLVGDLKHELNVLRGDNHRLHTDLKMEIQRLAASK